MKTALTTPSIFGLETAFNTFKDIVKVLFRVESQISDAYSNSADFCEANFTLGCGKNEILIAD